MTTTTDRTAPYYDPYDYDVDANAHTVWKRLRDEAPLYWNDKYGFFALSRFDDVLPAMLDIETFSSAHMHAAANVTTESGSFDWLVARNTVIRQTGRHALASVTQETQVRCADGKYVNTGFPPRHAKDFVSLRDWVDELSMMRASVVDGQWPVARRRWPTPVQRRVR